MKFLLMLSVMVLGIWLWRSNREAKSKLGQETRAAKSRPLEMVGCALCAVHIPAVDAVAGRKGLYCCLEHRHRAEP